MMTLFDDETIMRAYTKEIQDESRAEGRQEGRQEMQKETILSLPDMGMPPEKIARAVKVSLDTVLQWLDGRAAAIK